MERWKWRRCDRAADIPQKDRFPWNAEVCRFDYRALRILPGTRANVAYSQGVPSPFARRTGRLQPARIDAAGFFAKGEPMTKGEIAAVLEEIAALLELKGE